MYQSHFRVGNFIGNPMEDGTTSYFHQSIGGYHAAKMGRYNELFEYQIANNNIQILNMLNTKYFIITDKDRKPQVQQNPDANGNVWFAENIKVVNSANEEMKALDSLNTKKEAVIDISKIKTEENFKIEKDTLSTISLLNYNVTSLTYQSKTQTKQFAVFSEIFYKNGWNAYIDGKLTPHYRVNYVLRGMFIPQGQHTIEFKFEPKVIQQGKIISLSSYALLIFIGIGWFFYNKKKKNKP